MTVEVAATIVLLGIIGFAAFTMYLDHKESMERMRRGGKNSEEDK